MDLRRRRGALERGGAPARRDTLQNSGSAGAGRNQAFRTQDRTGLRPRPRPIADDFEDAPDFALRSGGGPVPAAILTPPERPRAQFPPFQSHARKPPRPLTPPVKPRPARSRPKPDDNGFSRTRRDHRRERAEDYVELIALLIRERGEARTVDMARRLGVSHVTVGRTLTRLAKEGLIRTEPYRAIHLTPAGGELAERARSRHQIVLDFLVAAGVPGPTAELDAEGIEHHVSPETIEALQRLTGALRDRKPE